MALTPVAALMFRFNNPDALLVLLLVRRRLRHRHGRSRSASTRWLVLAFALVGLGFITKMMQAFLVVPGIGCRLLLAAPRPWARRIRQLAGRRRRHGGVGRVVGGGGHADAGRRPAVHRRVPGQQPSQPHIRLQRLRPADRQRVRERRWWRRPGTSGQWGPTGLTRLFGSEMGSQISWLLPAALMLLAAVLVADLAGRPRTDRTRAAMVLWGGWLLVTGLVFSLAQGIIHPYYTVALAPAIGAIVGIGSWFLWCRRDALWARLAMGSVVAGSSIWAAVLLDRVPAWHPWLRTVIPVVGCIAGAASRCFCVRRTVFAGARRPVPRWSG